MSIGDKIKKARLEKGLTQEELGNLIGVQKSAVAKYEKGRVVNIKRSVLAKISKILDIPPVELVSDIKTDPVGTANQLANMLIGIDTKGMDSETMTMLEEYKQLDTANQSQVREYIHFLLSKG